MISLAIDTATLTGSVAITHDNQVLSEVSSRARATHSEQVISLVDTALALAGVTLADVNLLIVGLGPGSFTGIRIGVATAKGIALATNLRLVGVSSLAALAASMFRSISSNSEPILACLDARRDELYAEVFDGALTTIVPPRHASPESIGALATASFSGNITVVGDLTPSLRSRLSSHAPERFSFAPSPFATPIARFATLAASIRGVTDDGSLEPMYVRQSDAKIPASMQGPR